MADEKKIKKIDDPFAVLEELTKIGQKNKKVKISDNAEIVLETLNSSDEAKIFVETGKYEGSEFFTQHKTETLAYSIKEINGRSLREFENIEDEEKKSKLKKEAIDKIRSTIKRWKDELVSFVYSEFVILTEESEKEMVKIGIMKPLEKTKTETEKK